MSRENYLDMDYFRSRMRDDNIDAVVTASPTGLFHTTGTLILTHNPARDRLAFAITTSDGRQALVICSVEKSLTDEESWVEDVRTYVEFKLLPTHLLARTLDDLGLGRARIGIDMDYLRDKFFGELEAAAPDVSFVAADKILNDIYHRKAPGFLSRMREAARATDDALRETIAEAETGMTERQIRLHLRQALAQRGADASYLVVASGPNTTIPEHRAGDRRIQPGDILTLDAAASFDGFVADVAISTRVGSPPEAADNILASVYAEASRALRAGTTGAEVYTAAEAAAHRAGVSLAGEYAGYAMSYGGRDRPILIKHSEDVLTEGFTVALDIAIRTENDAVLRTKGVWLVGEAEAVCLAESGRRIDA